MNCIGTIGIAPGPLLLKIRYGFVLRIGLFFTVKLLKSSSGTTVLTFSSLKGIERKKQEFFLSERQVI
jgi:hypothetical protein